MITQQDEDQLDAALTRIADWGPDLVNGMTSHAPMVAEALAAMGRADAIDAWLAHNARQATAWPAPVSPVVARHWPSALGQPDRAADWRALFERELAEEDWRSVLDRWCGRLAPGAVASAAHGLIRVGHAARALARREHPARRAELAAALALWTSTYQLLPTRTTGPTEGYPPAEALARVERLPTAERQNDGAITTALARLETLPSARDVISLMAPPKNVEDAVRAHVELFSRVLLANARTPLETVVFTHSVTVFAAVGHIAPSVSDATRRSLLRRAWQVAAAIHAAYATQPPGPAAAQGQPPRTLIAHAVDHGDDHVIKLTETCLTWSPPGASSPAAAAEWAASLIPPVDRA